VIYIVAKTFTCGVLLEQDKVTMTAPIVKYMKGWTRQEVLNYCGIRGWTAEER
jgi:hypothetical protein